MGIICETRRPANAVPRRVMKWEVFSYREESDARLRQGGCVLGFDEQSLRGAPQHLDFVRGGAIRVELEIFVQIVQQGAVIFFAAVNVRKQPADDKSF